MLFEEFQEGLGSGSHEFCDTLVYLPGGPRKDTAGMLACETAPRYLAFSHLSTTILLIRISRCS